MGTFRVLGFGVMVSLQHIKLNQQDYYLRLIVRLKLSKLGKEHVAVL